MALALPLERFGSNSGDGVGVNDGVGVGVGVEAKVDRRRIEGGHL